MKSNFLIPNAYAMFKFFLFSQISHTTFYCNVCFIYIKQSPDFDFFPGLFLMDPVSFRISHSGFNYCLQPDCLSSQQICGLLVLLL